MTLPVIIGHEFVGVIEAIGNNATGFKIGDRVTAEGHIVCGKCRRCMAGRRHLCPNTIPIGRTLNGSFSEYISVPATNVWHADPSISDDIMSCFDPLGNAVHTALTFDLLGEDVLITGAGPIGCMAVAIAQYAGAKNVIVTDRNPYRLEIAKKMGATKTLNVETESLEEAMKELEILEGFDVGLEMSGSAQALNQLINNMFEGGKIALLGVLPMKASVDWTEVIFKSLTLKGIYGRKMYETWYKTTAMLKSGLNIDNVITHRIKFDEIEEGMKLMHSGKCGKIIMEW